MKKIFLFALLFLVYVGDSYGGSVDKLMCPKEDYNYYGPFIEKWLSLMI
ncbi:MAG: hypothetical protein AAFN93_25210 [Bacteroidota bacterium]